MNPTSLTPLLPTPANMSQGQRWEVAELQEWFDHHVTTPAARGLALAEARRFGYPHHADDLLHNWYLRVRVGLTRSYTSGVGPDIADEDAARAYTWKALRCTAIDLWRADRTQCELTDVPMPGHPVEDRAEVLVVVDKVREELARQLAAIPADQLGSPHATAVGVAFAIVEVGTGRLTGPLTDDLRGGTSEWDRLVHRALLVWDPPDVGEGTPGEDARTRQRRSRAGRRARRLLLDLFAANGMVTL